MAKMRNWQTNILCTTNLGILLLALLLIQTSGLEAKKNKGKKAGLLDLNLLGSENDDASKTTAAPPAEDDDMDLTGIGHFGSEDGLDVDKDLAEEDGDDASTPIISPKAKKGKKTKAAGKKAKKGKKSKAKPATASTIPPPVTTSMPVAAKTEEGKEAKGQQSITAANSKNTPKNNNPVAAMTSGLGSAMFAGRNLFGQFG